MSAERWLIDWFTGREIRIEAHAGDVQADYFGEGWVDSLGLVELVDAVESHFSVCFTAQHFEDRRFRSIEGLAAIIDELRSRR